jgi:predicted permease
MPVVIAIVAGALMSGLGLQLPGPVSTAVGMIANAAIAPALIVVGGTLALERSLKIEGAIVPILVGKLVLHPLLVAGGFMLVGNVPHDLAVAGIVMASAPMLTVYPILGQRFGEGPLCATALVVVTATGFFTMTLMLTAVGTPAP